MEMLHKLRIALAVTLLALTVVSVVDSASAADFGYYKRPVVTYDDTLLYSCNPCAP